MVSTIPTVYKSVKPYLKLSDDFESRDPVISYYAKLYSLQKAMQIDKKSTECKTYLMNIMDQLEKLKQLNKEEISSEIVGQAHVENVAIKIFYQADTADRAGNFSMGLVKLFYTAGLLFDILTDFGDISEDINKNRKYAKWKALYIKKCFDQNEVPVAGPLEGDDYDGDSNANNFRNENSDTIPVQPDNYGPTIIPSNVSQDPQVYPDNSASAPSEGELTLNQADLNKAQKYCTYANSALNYQDTKTAIDYLTRCLSLLKTGSE